MLVANPKISRLAAVGRFYVPLSQTQQNELVTAVSTIDKIDALPSWMSDYFAQVEQMFERDGALTSELAKHRDDHDQMRHAGGRRLTVEAPSFTNDEYDAVATYSTDAALQVNHQLRGLSRTRGIQPAQGVWRMSEKKIDAVVEKMDSAIDKSTLAEKLTVRREIPEASIKNTIFGATKGKTISDKGFLSMRRTESPIPPRKGFVTLQINAPAGTKALDLSFINPNAMGEIIFPRDTKIKIVNIVGRGEDTTVIGEIIG